MTNTNYTIDGPAPENAKTIGFYERDYYVFSNFSAFKIEWQGRMFATSEHAYQWSKFAQGNAPAQAVAQMILESKSAHEAFKIAQKYKSLQLENWNDVKRGIMKQILQEKARQHDYVREKLIKTGNAVLIEDSWRDSEWGWGPEKDGKNLLGKLWMEIRKGYTDYAKDLEKFRKERVFQPGITSPLSLSVGGGFVI